MVATNPINSAALEKAIKRAKILVVGDVMLDRYWFGDVSRISPEAPVPVVKVDHSEERLGGRDVFVPEARIALGHLGAVLVDGRRIDGRR